MTDADREAREVFKKLSWSGYEELDEDVCTKLIKKAIQLAEQRGRKDGRLRGAEIAENYEDVVGETVDGKKKLVVKSYHRKAIAEAIRKEADGKIS